MSLALRVYGAISKFTFMQVANATEVTFVFLLVMQTDFQKRKVFYSCFYHRFGRS